MAAWNERYPPSSGGVSSLTDLADVSVLSPLEGDILVYDETTGRWLNETPPAPEALVKMPFYTAAGNYDSISLVGTDRLPFFLANGSANNILMVT